MRRPGTACQQCRRGKRQCNRPVNAPCEACTKRVITCSSAETASKKHIILRPAESVARPPLTSDRSQYVQPDDCATSDALERLSHQQIRTLVEYYIEYIHDKPHTLFHTPSLRRSVEFGTIGKALLCAILGLVARFSPDEELRAKGPQLAIQAKTLLQTSLEDLSVSSIQAWILLGNTCRADRNYGSESLFFGIAIRSAHIIGLAEPVANETQIERQTRSRVWWSLLMLDRWSAAGLGTPRQMSDRHPSQELPAMEYRFHGVDVGQPLSMRASDERGLWAYMITLVEIFGPIQDLNRLVSMGAVDETFITSTVSNLSHRLDDWQRELPDRIRLSTQTMAFHQDKKQGRTFVALHLGYYHYATLLYFQYLDQSAAGLPYAAIYAQRCREHASAFSDLLRTSYEMESCEAMYNIVGHMAVVSSSVLIHTLLLGDERQLEPAKSRLESNFKILIRLKSWWPSVKIMIDRLVLFQKACLRTVDNHTHKIDRWMVKFLLEHGNVLSEKVDDAHFDTSSPENLVADSPGAERMMERDRFTRRALLGLRE